MKSKEAPKKIYILPHKDYSDKRIMNAFTEKEDNNDIEYTRTDAFVEKAVEWISNNCYIPHSTLEDFKNAMEGE